jgi:hypothetical protein
MKLSVTLASVDSPSDSGFAAAQGFRSRYAAARAGDLSLRAALWQANGSALCRESDVAALPHGHWVRTRVKVALTPDEKRGIGRPSAPRWELDVVAYSGSRNELLVVECKSYLDSYGVRSTSFEGPKASEERRYKLFSDEVLRRVVLLRLEKELVEQGFCPAGTRATLCLAAGKIYGDPAPLRAFFEKNQWRLFEAAWLVEGLHRVADESYDNSVASVLAKLLLREDRARKSESNSIADAEPSGYSTQPGFTNKNGQTVINGTGLPGTDHSQSIYVLRCGTLVTSPPS